MTPQDFTLLIDSVSRKKPSIMSPAPPTVRRNSSWVCDCIRRRASETRNREIGGVLEMLGEGENPRCVASTVVGVHTRAQGVASDGEASDAEEGV